MPEPVDRDDLPQATVSRPRRTKISAVWIIPIVAAIIGLGIAIQRLMTEGPTVTIVFQSAEGVEAGKTFVKYKDVNIGHVSAVSLTDNFGKVEVTAKIAKSAAGLMVEDAKFWVVSPRVTLSGVSGLGTLLSGNYIGLQPGKSTKKERHFTGLDEAPIVTDQPGKTFRLKAKDLGSLGIGAPVYYRRLPAGQVVKYELAADGQNVDVTVFVNAPYDKYVTPDTRFWNASGIDVSLGAGGVDVRTEGLVALLAGGLAFDTPSNLPSEPSAPPNTSFALYRDRTEAMKQPDTISRRYVLHFNETVKGLSVGAPVLLFGLPAGEVVDIGLSLDPGGDRIRPRVVITFFPERLVERVAVGQQAAARALVEGDRQARIAFVRRAVEQRGLRAQLRSGNLLTGQMYIAVDQFPDAPRPKIDWNQEPLELPVVPSTVPDLEAKLSSILAKLDSMPFDAIGRELESTVTGANKLVRDMDATLVPELRTTVDTANKLLGSMDGELKGILDEARRALASADRVLKNTDATIVGVDAPAQHDLRDALQEVARAARAVRVLADYLERHPESLVRGKNGSP
jgi:paraquat-inducible protein B